MKKRKVSTKFLLYFLMLMFLMVTVGCSSKDDALPAAATTYSIAGTVTGAASVVINLTGAATATTTTSGAYSFTGRANGTYTVTPVLAGYTFEPASKVVVINGSNMVGIDFTAISGSNAHTISGTVTGVGVSGAKITFSSASTTAEVLTGTDGTYTSPSLPGSMSYTVTPYHSGYAFTPTSLPVALGTVNSTGNNFVSAAANFTQADLEGTWNVQMLKSAASAKWSRATLTFDSSGALTGISNCLDSATSTACPASAGNLTWTINSSTGVIAEGGANAGTNVHMTLASNKTFIAGTEDNSKLLIAQKPVTGTSYVAGDVQSKNFVFHQFNVGSSNKWQYGAGTSSVAGAINISSQTDPLSGTTAPGDVGATISVDGSGVVSFSDNPTWKGFLSADKKTIVGTDTESGGTEFHMLIIQITNGQSSSLSQVVGTSYVHLLGTGASPAPFWAHETVSIASGGVISFADWVNSGSESVHSNTGTMSIGSSGTATVTLTSGTTDFHGQLSYDGTFMVATETYEPDVYTLDIFTH
jgi:hypothetical protein